MAGVGERGHYGAWRLVCAGPAILISVVLVAIVSALLGRYAIFGLLGWLLVGFVLLAPRAERATVRAVYRFETPAGPAGEWLRWLQGQAERRCRVEPGRLDWYVRDDATPNAFAAGRRSVAVTTGFLQLLYSGSLSHDQAVAVAVHEIGHHATRATRYGLIAEWLCWPWRATYRAVMRLGGHMPYANAAMLLLPVVFVIAIVQTAQLDGPPEQLIPAVALLIVLALGIFVAPPLDAVFARASERAADRYAVDRGAGLDLAAALQWTHPCRPAELLGWLHNQHPPTTSRVDRLTALRSASTEHQLQRGGRGSRWRE